ncbi:MAG: hypothetical protein RXR03_08090 [Thermocladium sp.]
MSRPITLIILLAITLLLLTVIGVEVSPANLHLITVLGKVLGVLIIVLIILFILALIINTVRRL